MDDEVDRLSKLTDDYFERGRKDPRSHWPDLLKAHTLYNACALRQPDPRWSQAAYNVQTAYWQDKVDMTYQEQQELTDELRTDLMYIRKTCRHDLEPLTELIGQWQCDYNSIDSEHNKNINCKFSQSLKTASMATNERMKEYTKNLMQKAVMVCIKPACTLSLVALGSLAKGEATPYSDVEFMLLVEHKSSAALAYFELLSMTIYFFIGNLQETNLKYMNIQELRDFTDKSMNGFRLDGLQPKAGNIPTGNGTCEQQNKFILTPNELINHYRTTLDNPDPNESLKGDFTAMLAHTTLIAGDPDLLGEFETAREEMKKNYQREESDQAMLMQDINDYDFIPLYALCERFHKVNLKSDVYRFPSIVIYMYNLKILYNIRSSNSWETLRQLHGKNLMSRPCYDCLKLLLATAQYTRLSAYLFHDSQSEAVTFLQKSETAQSMRGSSGLWHMPYRLRVKRPLP